MTSFLEFMKRQHEGRGMVPQGSTVDDCHNILSTEHAPAFITKINNEGYGTRVKQAKNCTAIDWQRITATGGTWASTALPPNPTIPRPRSNDNLLDYYSKSRVTATINTGIVHEHPSSVIIMRSCCYFFLSPTWHSQPASRAPGWAPTGSLSTQGPVPEPAR